MGLSVIAAIRLQTCSERSTAIWRQCSATLSGKALATAVAHPIKTAKAIGNSIAAEYQGANEEEALGNVFTAAVVRGRLPLRSS